MTALTEELLKSLSQEQQNNLKSLYELIMRDGQVNEKAAKLFEKGFQYEPYGDGLALSVCEDWDDLTVANMFKQPEKQHPIYREKREIDGKIKETLRESLKLGLGYLALIQRQCKNYQVDIQTA